MSQENLSPTQQLQLENARLLANLGQLEYEYLFNKQKLLEQLNELQVRYQQAFQVEEQVKKQLAQQPAQSNDPQAT